MLTNTFYAVYILCVVYLGKVGFWPLSDARYLCAILWLHTDNLNGRIFFFEKTLAAHDGSGSAHATNEVSDTALRVTPNFRRGPLVVR